MIIMGNGNNTKNNNSNNNDDDKRKIVNRCHSRQPPRGHQDIALLQRWWCSDLVWAGGSCDSSPNLPFEIFLQVWLGWKSALGRPGGQCVTCYINSSEIIFWWIWHHWACYAPDIISHFLVEYSVWGEELCSLPKHKFKTWKWQKN